MSNAAGFLAARDQLLRLREDQGRGCREFVWPQLAQSNWAIDYFDPLGAAVDRVAVRVVDDSGTVEVLTYADLVVRSTQVANFLSSWGVVRGDRVLFMLGNVIPLWETMLAIMKV